MLAISNQGPVVAEWATREHHIFVQNLQSWYHEKTLYVACNPGNLRCSVTVVRSLHRKRYEILKLTSTVDRFVCMRKTVVIICLYVSSFAEFHQEGTRDQRVL